MLILDTHGPSCWTPYPLTAKAGARATLRYKVTDKLSGWATATVEILRGGSVVRTLKPRFVRTGEFVQRSLLCDLDPGTYTVRVTARDEAGNEQARVGTTTLTVEWATVAKGGGGRPEEPPAAPFSHGHLTVDHLEPPLVVLRTVAAVPAAVRPTA